jgi:hypothetical protein
MKKSLRATAVQVTAVVVPDKNYVSKNRMFDFKKNGSKNLGVQSQS